MIAAAAGLGAAAACGRGCDAVHGLPTASVASVPDRRPRVGAGPDGLDARAPRPSPPPPTSPSAAGRVFPDLRVVVTQPSPGEFRGFGIVCTHDGCELNAVTNGTINCPCHGSRYAITDGSVVRGPARTGLRTERSRSTATRSSSSDRSHQETGPAPRSRPVCRPGVLCAAAAFPPVTRGATGTAP